MEKGDATRHNCRLLAGIPMDRYGLIILQTICSASSSVASELDLYKAQFLSQLKTVELLMDLVRPLFNFLLAVAAVCARSCGILRSMT